MKRKTVEQSFNDWWRRWGPKSTHGYDDSLLADLRTWARVSWSNGYRLGQRREKAKR